MKFVLLAGIVVMSVGCAELSTMMADPSFKTNIESLTQSLAEINAAKEAKNKAESNAQPQRVAKTEAPAYTDRPCENLTNQTKDYTNRLRSAYPNANSNSAQQCAMAKNMRQHLTAQRSAAASCDRSGAYREGLTNSIKSYSQLVDNLKCG